jgi:hypothetical protein
MVTLYRGMTDLIAVGATVGIVTLLRDGDDSITVHVPFATVT